MPAVPLIQVLTVLMPIRLAIELLTPALQATGNADVVLKNLLLMLVVSGVVLSFASSYGMEVFVWS